MAVKAAEMVYGSIIYIGLIEVSSEALYTACNAPRAIHKAFIVDVSTGFNRQQLLTGQFHG